MAIKRIINLTVWNAIGEVSSMNWRQWWERAIAPAPADEIVSERMCDQLSDAISHMAPSEGGHASEPDPVSEQGSNAPKGPGDGDGRARRILKKIREYRKLWVQRMRDARGQRMERRIRERERRRTLTPAQRAQQRRRKWKRVGWWALGIGGAMCVALAVLLDFGSWVWLDEAKLVNLRRTTLMYDSDDIEVAGLYLGENRLPVDVTTLPDYVRYAFVAAEDARFYEHHGVDLWRIGGALLSNIKSGGYSEGASTITQQLIKLTHLSADKTLARKANEAVLALVLETRYSKDDILGMYMNTVYFGHGAYGIEAAARAYFSKSASELDIAQSAMLAAIIKAPSSYAPHIAPERALTRRNWVLGEMLRQGYISQTEYDAALVQPIELTESHQAMPEYGWYIDYALAEAERLLSLTPDELLSGGYRIYTSLDTGLQSRAQQLFESAEFPPDSADGTECQGALCALDNTDGAILALVGGREYEVRRGLNRATDVKRQPGSAIKPLAVYAPAIDSHGFLPTSFLSDVPTDFNGWSPRNAGNKYRGIVTLRQAAASSINVATVELLDMIGIDAGIEFLNSVGIETDARDAVLPLALGAMTYGTSPLELCGAYSTFARDGEYTEPYAIRYILDSSGAPVYIHESQRTRVMSEQSAYIMTGLMRSVVTQGTASKLASLDMSVGAKTGTAALSEQDLGVSGNRDIWLAACTPGMTLTVWMGFDRTDAQHYMPESASGSNQPTLLARELLASEEARAYTAGSFERPEGLSEAIIDLWALNNLHMVMLAGDSTPADMLMREVFTPDSLPTQVSPLFDDALPAYDLTGARDESGVPYVEFTCPQQYTEYRVYRDAGEGRVLVGTLAGETGSTLRLSDFDAPDQRSLRYDVVAYSPARDVEGATASIVIERSLWSEFGRMLPGGWGSEGTPLFTALPYGDGESMVTPEPTAEPTPAAPATAQPTSEPTPSATFQSAQESTDMPNSSVQLDDNAQQATNQYVGQSPFAFD